MTVQNAPAALTYTGNLKDIVVNAVAEDINIKISHNGQQITNETYSPNHENKVTLKIRDLVDELLTIQVVADDQPLYAQTKAVGVFSININSEITLNFTAIKGGVDTINFDADLFFKSRWLTWQPQTKSVGYHDPSYLSYYAIAATTVKAKAYFADQTQQTIDLATLEAGKLSTINTNYGRLIGLFTAQPVYVDIWTETAGTRLSYVQRFILTSRPRSNADTYVFQNTLGGIDTIVFHGSTKLNNEINIDSAIFDETQVDFKNADQFTITKNTGYIETPEYRQFILDFMVSQQKYTLFDTRLRAIVLKDHNVEHHVFEMNDYEFSYQFALDTKYKNIYRSPDAPAPLEIIDPEGEVFFLPPRLNEFPEAIDYDNLLLPVQDAFSPVWMRLSVASFKEAIITEVLAITGGGGGGSTDLAILALRALRADKADRADEATRALLADEALHATSADHATIADNATNAVTAETAITANHATTANHASTADHAARANIADYALDSDKWDGHQFADYLDQPVRTTDDVRHKSISSPSFSTGFTGHGFRIDLDENGNYIAEVDRLLVRKDFNVYELIVQELRSTNGAVIVSDGIKITGATPSGANYICDIDTDDGTIGVPFRIDDVLRCQVFNGKGLKYFVARVLAVTSSTFTITILEGGGVPAAEDDLVRIDNFTDANRKGIVYITGSDSGAPYIDTVYGMWTDPGNSVKVRMGNLSGIIDPVMGALTGFGFYGQNVNIRGNLWVTGGNAETVTGSQNKADNAYSNAIAFTNTQFQVLDGKIEGKVSQTQVDDSINNIKVGGRNLLRYSNTEEVFSLYGVTGDVTNTVDDNQESKQYIRLENITRTIGEYVFYLPVANNPNILNRVPIANQSVVLSFRARANAAGLTMWGHGTAINDLTLDTTWRTYAFHINPVGTGGNWHFGVAGDNLQWMEFTGFKVEKGNKYTDWTLAPEDEEVGSTNTYSNKLTEVGALGGAYGIIKNVPETPNGFSATGYTDSGNGVRLYDVITETGWWTVSGWFRGSQGSAGNIRIDICDKQPYKEYKMNTDNSWTYFEHSVFVSEIGYKFVDIAYFDWLLYYFKNIKVEKGNKATAWSLSPLDVEEEFKQITTRVINSETLISQNAQQILLKASKTEVTTEINNIQVGGNNLVLDSDTLHESNGYGIAQGKLSEDIVIGQEYVITIWGTTTNNAYFGLWDSAGSVGSYGIHRVSEGKFQGKFSPDDWVGDKDKFSIYQLPYTTNNYVRIEKIKIEKGNKGTDWSPSALDIESNAVTSSKTYTDSQIVITNEAITLQSTRITGLDGRIAQAEIKLQPDNIWLGIESKVKEDINEIQVGGRNYYKKTTPIYQYDGAYGLVRTETGFNVVGVGANNATVRILGVITENGWWTVSFEHKIEYGGYPLLVDICDREVKRYEFPEGNVWKKMVYSVYVDDYSTTYNFVDISGLTGQWHYFRDIKVEQGNKATSWTLAPEDVKSDVTKEVDDTTLKNSWIQGKPLNPDPTFIEGFNGIGIYNNTGNNTDVLFQRLAKSDFGEVFPTMSPYGLYFYRGVTASTSPDFGGFHFSTPTRPKAKFLVRMVLAFEENRSINFNSNSGGYNAEKSRWLTPVEGKGVNNFEEYIYYTECDTNPAAHYQNTNYFYFAPTLGGVDAVSVRIAFAGVYDITDYNELPTKEQVKSGINIGLNGVDVFGKQINLNGIVTFQGDNAINAANNAQGAANAAQGTANSANSLANTANGTANSALGAANTANSNLSNLQSSLGSLAYDNAVALAKLDSSIMQGGYFKTNLINATEIFSQNVTATGLITALNLNVTGTSKIGSMNVDSNGFLYNNNAQGGMMISGAGTFAAIGPQSAPGTLGLPVPAWFESNTNLDTNFAMVVMASGATNKNVAIAVTATGNNPYAIEVGGGLIKSKGHAYGVFRVTGSNQTIPPDCDVVLINSNVVPVNLYLPTYPKVGQAITIKNLSGNDFNLTSNNGSIQQADGSFVNTNQFARKGVKSFMMDGNYWVELFRQ